MSASVESPASSATADTARAAGRVRVPVICRLRDLCDLREQLLTCLPIADPVAIDACEVESIDTASLQLLFAFERDRTRIGRATVYAGASAAFRTAVATLGLKLSLPATGQD